MKAIFMMAALIFSVSTVMAQEIKDTYEVKGDVIEATLYHDNGVVAQTGFYTKENKLHGEWISYDNEGNKTAVAQYDNGKKVGTWMFYQGETKKEVTYSDSKIAEVTTWKVSDTRVVSNK